MKSIHNLQNIAPNKSENGIKQKIKKRRYEYKKSTTETTMIH